MTSVRTRETKDYLINLLKIAMVRVNRDEFIWCVLDQIKRIEDDTLNADDAFELLEMCYEAPESVDRNNAIAELEAI